MPETRGSYLVSLTAHMREEHDWVARNGNAWGFRLMQVLVDGRVDGGCRLALLVSEDDVEQDGRGS